MTTKSRNRKTPTIQDVAAELGLHTSTVSLALSGKGTISAATRQKVIATARALGYRPNPLAQRLASSVSSSLVCIMSSPLDVGIGTQKLLLIQNALVAKGLEVPLYTYAGPLAQGAAFREDTLVSQIRQICRQRPRAIVCAGSAIHPAVYPELEYYQKEGGIVVSYDIPVPLECDQVIFDRDDNAYKVACCLLQAGHRRIGLAMSVPPSWSTVTMTARLAGFGKALEEYGVPLREDWLFLHESAYEQGGEDLARRFLAMEDRPTALCIVNDYVAMAFMVEAMRAGLRVPEDISIVSHDNQRITALCPVPMTSATHPVEAIAESVVQMLTERIEGFSGAPRIKTLQGELISRKSVAPPPEEQH